jgi:SAM-dependent methyltransferase
MRNISSWRTSKYVIVGNKLVSSKDPNEVHIGSRLVVNISAFFYNKYLCKYASGRLLDLGCGKVPLYEAYKEFINENICIDWPNTIHKNHYLDFEYDLNQILPFDSNSFNTIILSDVLEHIENTSLLFMEMNRLLAKEGKLLLNVPFFYWLHETPNDYYRFTEYALKKFSDAAGFKILILHPTGGIIEIFADLAAKTILYIPILGAPLSILLQSMTLSFLKTKIGQKISTKSSKVFPLGYFLIAEKS